MQYRLATAPDDYKVWWQQQLEDIDLDIDIDSVVLPCVTMHVKTFREEFLHNLSTWDESDLLKVIDFTEDGVLDLVPPLVHTDGFLNDGYHRLAACYWTGRMFMPCVNLAVVVFQTKRGKK